MSGNDSDTAARRPLAQTRRGVSTSLGTLVLVLTVVILVATLSVGVLSLSIQESPPTATFDVDTTSDIVVFTHTAGDTIDGDNLAIRGADHDVTVDQLQAGTRIEITNPTSTDVELIWTGEQSSYVLASATVQSSTPTTTQPATAITIIDESDTVLAEGDIWTPNEAVTITNTGDTPMQVTITAENPGQGVSKTLVAERLAQGEQITVESGEQRAMEITNITVSRTT